MIDYSNLKTTYPRYIKLIKDSAIKTSKELGTKVYISPTDKKICHIIGINKETANCINTIEYLKAIYTLLKEKGYKIPKVFISEEKIPRKNNIAGLQAGDWNIFGPGNLDTCGPSVVIHECGHFLHNKNMFWNQPFYSLLCSFTNIFRSFLNKNEREILTNDYKRAYQEGYFKDLELANCVKKGFISEKTIKNFRKEPEKYLVKNSFRNVSEFIAEYFTLAVKGFKFSPKITQRYEAFNGPEIKKTISKEEFEKLIKLKKTLEKRNDIQV